MAEIDDNEIQPALFAHSLAATLPEMNSIKQLNEKILAITMHIQNKFPELSKYLVEMSVTIPAVKNPVINSVSLQKYYESLKAIINKYKPEYSQT